MKKISFRLIVLFTFLPLWIGCSGDDNSSQTGENPVLIKKITEMVYYGDEVETTTNLYTYQNNVLKTIISGDVTTQLVYQGDKIIRADYFVNGTLGADTKLFYNGDLLDYTLADNDMEKTQYYYTNGILSKIESISLISGESHIHETEEYVFNTANNILKLDRYTDAGFSEITRSTTYTYDSMNSPMKFMNKYYRMVFIWEGFRGINNNNVISSESFSPIGSTTASVQNYEITYNDADFPTEIKKFSPDNTLISVTTIEYQ